MGCTPFEDLRAKLAAEMGERLADMGVARLEVVFVKENEMGTGRKGFALCTTLVVILVLGGIWAFLRGGG